MVGDYREGACTPVLRVRGVLWGGDGGRNSRTGVGTGNSSFNQPLAVSLSRPWPSRKQEETEGMRKAVGWGRVGRYLRAKVKIVCPKKKGHQVPQSALPMGGLHSVAPSASHGSREHIATATWHLGEVPWNRGSSFPYTSTSPSLVYWERVSWPLLKAKCLSKT